MSRLTGRKDRPADAGTVGKLRSCVVQHINAATAQRTGATRRLQHLAHPDQVRTEDYFLELAHWQLQFGRWDAQVRFLTEYLDHLDGAQAEIERDFQRPHPQQDNGR